MATEGNGKPILHRIIFAGATAPLLKSLRIQARTIGLGQAYAEAVQAALFRIRHNPWGFGEMIGRLPHSPMTIHVAIVKPLLIEFAIHEEQPIVFIKRVQLLT